jgi:hypothetical protein
MELFQNYLLNNLNTQYLAGNCSKSEIVVAVKHLTDTLNRASLCYTAEKENLQTNVNCTQIALLASHAALRMVISTFRYNVALQTSYKKWIQIICITSTRRTSGHCLGTLKTGNTFSRPLPNIVSLNTPPPPPLSQASNSTELMQVTT